MKKILKNYGFIITMLTGIIAGCIVGALWPAVKDAAGNVSEYSFEILWKMPAVAIVLIVIAALGVVGTVVWLVISKKRKDEYYSRYAR